jgi:hypothetical protein
MKDKGEPSIPDLLELVVDEALLGAGVEPLGHVRVAIRVLGRRFHFDVRHAPPALQLIVGVAAQGEPIAKPCS